MSTKAIAAAWVVSGLFAAPLHAMAVRIVGLADVEPGTACPAGVAVTNATERSIHAKVLYSLRRNPQNVLPRLPEPGKGADHALGRPSWIEVDGERIDDGSLTDGSEFTGHDEARAFTEAFHVVDLGQVRQVTHLTYQAGDANWIRRVDVAASDDGEAYESVPGLQDLDFHKKWGRQELAVPTPFAARFLRLRYHDRGAPQRFLRTPVALHVFDGPSPDEYVFPDVGVEIESGMVELDVPPRSEVTVSLACRQPLGTGAYLLCVRMEVDDHLQLMAEPVYVLPPPIAELPPDSPFGLNGASFELPERNRRLGVKWMRFENMKWQMSMPGPDRYAFDGSVAPWSVRHDEYMRRHAELGMKVLPYTFQTPRWLSRAPEGTAKNVAGHPPKDFATYGDMMFQLAARYGSTKHPDAALKSNDKLSGLGLLDTFQLWNEPNLVGPDWAPWVGTMEEYLEIFRIGAEAVKRADPKARVTPAGLAGISVTTIDPLYRYRYADGKRPVDFADILSVHYYSGRQDPEVATLDRNATRTGQAAPGAPAYPEALAQLVDWRDDHAPGKPLWMTETGNDVGGPMGLGEWEQGGKIPRVTMLALAAGIDKVFIYREKGSVPAQHAGAGLVRDDDTLRASWFTYATLVRQFDGVKPGRAWRIAHPDPNVWIHVWERRGEPLVTAWSIRGDAALGLDLGECEVVDAFGHAERRDTASLRLGYYPHYIGSIAKPETLAPFVAAAKAKEAERQAKRRADTSRPAVLFDFGSRHDTGTLVLGTLRPYHGVVATDLYEDVRGWGFEPRAALRDGSAHWVADPLRKDSVRVDKGVRFRFRVAAGAYRVSLLAQPLGREANVTLAVDGQSVAIALAKDTEPQPFDVQTNGGDVTLSTDGYVELQALSLVGVG